MILHCPFHLVLPRDWYNTVENTMFASVYYIAYIACGSASLYIKMLYFFLAVLVLSAAATVANIKIRYE